MSAGPLAPAGSPPYPGDILEPFSISGERWEPGKVTVFACFAYWCDTWKTQVKRVAEAERLWQGLPVETIAISVDPRWAAMDSTHRWSRRLIDQGSVWSRRMGIDRVPYTLVVDESGRIVWASYGISRSRDLVGAVRRALEMDPAIGGSLFLTFDDFPAKNGNREVLEALREANCQATFFVIGENGQANPGLLRESQQQGHRLAVHGWKHEPGAAQPDRVARWLDETFAVKRPWLRLPGSSVLLRGGKTFAGPTINPYDYHLIDSSELLRRVLYNLKPGAVIQLHAGVPSTTAALPFLIARARELGYEVGPLPEDLSQDPEPPTRWGP